MARLSLRAAAYLALCLTLLLVACGGGGGGGEEEHEHTHIDSAGRLALIEAGSSSVRVYDLDSKSVVATVTMANPPSSIYPSPGHRYAVAIQRTQDLVQFVDGGLWQEDHGDHLHDYKETPRLLRFQLQGSRPTHYETHEGLAALFLDGLESPPQNAGAVVFSDTSLEGSGVVAALPLATYMHGTAEPRGDYLLATYRDPGAEGTLPDQVELYQRNGSSYRFLRRFDEVCPGLHGSFSNEDHSVFGCIDGVLVVTQSGDDFTARKIANPPGMPVNARIGTVTGHDHLKRFVGIASPGLLYDIDPDGGTITPILWAENRTRRAHLFDAEGENLLVLDDRGTLHVLDPADDWAARAQIAVVQAMPAEAPFPSIAASRAGELVFVNDPAARDVAVIDLHDAVVKERLPLGFSPTGIVWLGIERHDEHGH